MVFIIGYVFGSFSKNRTLTVLTKIAAILTIVFFILANVAMFRGGRWHGHGGHYQANRHCMYEDGRDAGPHHQYRQQQQLQPDTAK